MWLKIVDKALSIWLSLLNRTKKKSAGDAYVDFSEINSIIKNWVHVQHAFGIERAYIFRSHNGIAGNRLMPAGFKYVSALAGDQRKPFVDMLKTYQNIPQDNINIDLLARLYQKKELHIKTAELEPGMLKDLYMKEGLQQVRMYFLADNEAEVWFLSIGTSQQGEHFDTVQQKSSLFLGVTRIRQITKPYFK